MQVDYDDIKRSLVLKERGLDLADAGRVFDDFQLTRWDESHRLDEDRYQTVGLLDDVVVIVIWTERKGRPRIVTMWKANERERIAYFRRREQSG